jgi:dihydrofolate synthase/folylpolyglutamate synthase
VTYKEAVEFLFSRLPVFHRIGAAAYKPGLETTISLLEALDNPHKKFKSIHIAGTNGKGSSSHSLASILQEAGYKTGLYTSPHLFDFRERIRINGQMIPEEKVVQMTEDWQVLIDQLKPSFFELTVAMAFKHFADEKVDIAVVEVGMGGRLDSTNVITPELSLITNIGMDHQKFLGNTIGEIAGEKAGIIKPGIPVVISEDQEESRPVFMQKASLENAPIQFASEILQIEDLGIRNGKREIRAVYNQSQLVENYQLALTGNYQLKNIAGVLASVEQLKTTGYSISQQAISEGLENVKENTGLYGRWDVIQEKPMLICDTAHNEDGVKQIVTQLSSLSYKSLWLVWGMVDDKDHHKILSLLPKSAKVIACQPDIPRALSSEKMAELFKNSGFDCQEISEVGNAIHFCLEKAEPEDLIYVGGSTFTVASIPYEIFFGSQLNP